MFLRGFAVFLAEPVSGTRLTYAKRALVTPEKEGSDAQSGRMGGGTELQAVDIDGDGGVDVVAGGKSGLFLARNMTKETTATKTTAAARRQ